jgi:hypothetical protein
MEPAAEAHPQAMAFVGLKTGDVPALVKGRKLDLPQVEGLSHMHE